MLRSPPSHPQTRRYILFNTASCWHLRVHHSPLHRLQLACFLLDAVLVARRIYETGLLAINQHSFKSNAGRALCTIYRAHGRARSGSLVQLNHMAASDKLLITRHYCSLRNNALWVKQNPQKLIRHARDPFGARISTHDHTRSCSCNSFSQASSLRHRSLHV